MNRLDLYRRLATAALLFVLLAEWMKPLAMMGEATGIYRIEPFLFTLAGLFAVDALGMHPVPAWTVKALIIMSLPAMLFGESGLWDFEWWGHYADILSDDLSAIAAADWLMISPEFRTLMFILSWAVVAACLFHAVYYQRFVLWFTAGTMVYLACLNVWLDLPTYGGLWRAAAAGFILHAIYVPQVLMRQYGVRHHLAVPKLAWPAAALLLAVLVVGAGSAAARLGGDEPRAHPAWFAFGNWHAWAERMGVAPSVSSTGYGSDDSELGGKLRIDDSPVFAAAASSPGTYWRGEAKTIYDGRGWRELDNEMDRYDLQSAVPDAISGMPAPSPAADGQDGAGPAADEGAPAAVYWLADSWRTPASGYARPLLVPEAPRTVSLLSADSLETVTSGVLMVDMAEGNYRLAGIDQPIAGYIVRTASNPQASANDSAMHAQLHLADPELYLQLPDHFPSRVRELAREIAAPYSSAGEQAAAIEHFLRTNYEYTLEPPEAGEGDFVEQFLFHQKAGYCDYFSTAMAVMLRSVGIPARWVKGFAPGEPLDPEKDAHWIELLAEWTEAAPAHYSRVRNSDAHSWVEAFIPGQGWVAYEPTPAYAGQTGLPGRHGGVGLGEQASAPAAAAVSREWRVRLQDSLNITTLQSLSAFGVRSAVQLLEVASGIVQRASAGHAAAAGSAGLLAAVLALVLSHRAARIRLGLWLYAGGWRGRGADARLLEAMLRLALGPCSGTGHETLREAVMRAGAHADRRTAESSAHSPQPAASDRLVPDESAALWQAVLLFEQLRFGPPALARTPARQMIRIWRSLNGKKL